MALMDRFRQIVGRRTDTHNNLLLAEGSGQRRIVLSGDRVATYELLYQSQPPVAAAVNKLTRQISTLPLKVYREGADGELERVRDHPLQRLLHAPAPRCGAHSVGQWAALPTLVFGNALIVKVRGADGLPVGLLPVDWRYVNAYASEGGPIAMWSTTQTGEELMIHPSEALHFAWMGAQGWLGVSPLAQLDSTLRIEDSARRFQIANFDNGARPSGALVLQHDIDPNSETAKRLRRSLEALHKGVDQAGRVMLLGGGMDWKQFAQTVVETELIAQRKMSREEIAMVYDVPPPLLGDMERGTFSNIEELYKQLYKTTLRPWLAMIEATINAQLVDPEPDWAGLRVRFDLSEVLRGDHKEEIAATTEAVKNGLMSVNEARKILGLNPRPEKVADQMLVQANNVAPLSALPSGDGPGVAGDEPAAVTRG